MSDEIVIVRSFSNEVEANLAISELEDAGIDACMMSPTHMANYPSFAMMTGIAVGVRADDVAAARAFLDAPPEPDASGL